MTDGQSASLSWYQAPIWGPKPDIYYCQTVAGLLMWGTLSDDRTGLSFTTAAGPCQRSHSQVRVPRDSCHVLLSQIRDSSNLEGQVRYLYPLGTGWPSYTPRHWVPFPSPPMTCRATLEVFEPAPTWGDQLIDVKIQPQTNRFWPYH
jgi:hypothetical protein